MWRRSKKQTGALTTANTSWTDQSQCRLLQLPAELRNRIYMLALVDDDDQRRKIGIDLRKLRKPALTSTCRQIQFEALPIFFGNNCFRLVIIIGKDWRKLPTLTPTTQAWIKRAGDLAQPFREVRFIIEKPDQRRHFVAMLATNVSGVVCADDLPVLGFSVANAPLPASNSVTANQALRRQMQVNGRSEVNMVDLSAIAVAVFRLSQPRYKRWLKARFGGERVDRWSCALRDKIQRSYLIAPGWVADIIWYGVEKFRNEKARAVAQREQGLKPHAFDLDGVFFPRNANESAQYLVSGEVIEGGDGDEDAQT